MARIKRGVTTHKRHKKVIAMAKGYRGCGKNCFRTAVQKVEKGLQYAYRDRRNKKRDFRALWIQRINAAVRESGLVYSRFMKGVKLCNIALNRKSLSEMAIKSPEGFAKVVDLSKKALEKHDKDVAKSAGKTTNVAESTK